VKHECDIFQAMQKIYEILLQNTVRKVYRLHSKSYLEFESNLSKILSAKLQVYP